MSSSRCRATARLPVTSRRCRRRSRSSSTSPTTATAPCSWRAAAVTAAFSVKTCKGFYKSLVNAARAEAWSAEAGGAGGFLLSAEDLSAQAGHALHQNLALWSFLGLADSERNGHHYGPGLARLPAAERDAFTTAHGDLYASGRLRIAGGSVALGTVNAAAGFGAAVPVTVTDGPAMAEPSVAGRAMAVE